MHLTTRSLVAAIANLGGERLALQCLVVVAHHRRWGRAHRLPHAPSGSYAGRSPRDPVAVVLAAQEWVSTVDVGKGEVASVVRPARR